MILVCPSCDTRYKVDDTSLGEEGRQVKCARCGNLWHAHAEQEEPIAIDTRAADIFSGVDGQSDGDSQTDNDESAVPPVADLSVSRTGPDVESIGLGKPPKSSRAGWAVLGLAIVGIVLAGYAARDQLIAVWPPAAKLYDTLGIAHGGSQIVSDLAGGGLVLEGVESKWNQSDGMITLTVSGSIVNNSKIERPVPPLVIWLASEDDRQLQSWSITLDAEMLAPGETAQFETSIDDPADEAMRVEIAVLDS